MKVICCACGTQLGNKPSHGADDGLVSHGFCETCAHHFLAQLGMPLARYVEGIPVPVVVVGPEGTIGTANFRALALLGKRPEQILGFRGGDVFECEYARLPGGCGQTVHCSGCAIRNTVMDTMRTGATREDVPAFLDQCSQTGTRRLELLITTEKKGGVVFLRIERISGAGPGGNDEAKPGERRH